MAIIDRITGKPWVPVPYDDQWHGVDEAPPFQQDMKKFWDELLKNDPKAYFRIFKDEIIELDVAEESKYKNNKPNALIKWIKMDIRKRN